jgi:uncharacterized phage protein (TIGR02218 family)
VSKTVDGPTAANITTDNHLVQCFFVKQRISGTIQGFTMHDKDLDKDLGDGNGVVTYQAANSFIQRAINNTDTFAVDNSQVEAILDSSAFDPDDIDAGVYDRALIKIFLLDWTDTSLDAIALRRGSIGEITIAEKSFTAELRGMLQRYTEEIVEVYTPSCRVDLGDTRCGERLDPPVWTASTAFTVREVRDTITGSVVKPTSFNDRHFKCTTAGTSGGSEPSWNLTIDGTTSDGTVTWTTIQARTIEVTVDTVTDNGTFTVVYSGDAPDIFLTGGVVTFLRGRNTEVPPIEVKTWVLSTRKVTLFLPAPFDVGGITDSFLGLEDGSGHILLESGDNLLLETGDRIDIKAGCAKDVATCRDTFDNIFNLQGEPHVPGTKVLFRTPNSQ